jgi:hypothetical protein
MEYGIALQSDLFKKHTGQFLLEVQPEVIAQPKKNKN